MHQDSGIGNRLISTRTTGLDNVTSNAGLLPPSTQLGQAASPSAHMDHTQCGEDQVQVTQRGSRQIEPVDVGVSAHGIRDGHIARLQKGKLHAVAVRFLCDPAEAN